MEQAWTGFRHTPRIQRSWLPLLSPWSPHDEREPVPSRAPLRIVRALVLVAERCAQRLRASPISARTAKVVRHVVLALTRQESRRVWQQVCRAVEERVHVVLRKFDTVRTFFMRHPVTSPQLIRGVEERPASIGARQEHEPVPLSSRRAKVPVAVRPDGLRPREVRARKDDVVKDKASPRFLGFDEVVARVACAHALGTRIAGLSQQAGAGNTQVSGSRLAHARLLSCPTSESKRSRALPSVA